MVSTSVSPSTSKSTSPSPSTPRPRNSQDKLYEAVLDLCVQGIQKFPVSSRSPSNTYLTANNLAPVSSPATTSKPPQPATPSSPTQPLPPNNVSASGLQNTKMNRPHSGSGSVQPHLRSAPAPASQDARRSSNLAVQPVAYSGSISLKKSSVKVTRPAAPLPAGPTKAPSAPTNVMSSSTGPVKAVPKVADGFEAISASGTSTPASQPNNPTQKVVDEDAALHELFAKLSASTRSSSQAKPSPLAGHVKDIFMEPGSAAIQSKRSDSSVKVTSEVQKKVSHEILDKALSASSKQEQAAIKNVAKMQAMNPNDVEREYLHKAAKYLTSIPSGASTTSDLIQKVIAKLRVPYAETDKMDSKAVEHLKSLYLGAVVDYLKSVNPDNCNIKKELVDAILVKGNGDFIYLLSVLVEDKMLKLNNIQQVTALCRAIEGVILKEPKASSSTPDLKPKLSPAKDPMEGMKTWPAQEKREDGPGYRTCFLKPMTGIHTLNQLQSLVWGGRVEAFHLPTPGSGLATVKFLTAEACAKFLEATKNGIVVPDQKDPIFVDKSPGPNSANDVTRNCVDGDASRCIRAYNADDDWSGIALMKVARGRGTTKREVDCIKRGKTEKGLFFFEFRFGSITNALSFKHELMKDEDWEHTNIVFGTDPCEAAQGVHIDEDGSKLVSSM